MLPIRKSCCCVEKKPDLKGNLGAIMDDDSAGFGSPGARGVTYRRSNLLFPCRTCDSTSSQCPNKESWGDQPGAFYGILCSKIFFLDFTQISTSLEIGGVVANVAAYVSALSRYRRTRRVHVTTVYSVEPGSWRQR